VREAPGVMKAVTKGQSRANLDDKNRSIEQKIFSLRDLYLMDYPEKKDCFDCLAELSSKDKKSPYTIRGKQSAGVYSFQT
jgi:hypothetical protein